MSTLPSTTLFLDSVISAEIAKYAWLIKGVTTTPTFFKRDGINYEQFITQLRTDHPDLEVHVEALGPTLEQTEQEIANIINQAWYNKDKVVLKVPISLENLQLVKKYSARGVRFNVHLIFTPQQAAVAALAGGSYVCPLLGRFADTQAESGPTDQRNESSRKLIEEVVAATFPCNPETLVMASSIRSQADFMNALFEGADVITVPTKILGQALHHDMTTQGIETFLLDMGY